jgi:signal transduction histidine kinase
VTHNENNEPVKMLGVSIDITEMKRAELKIKQMNEELELTVIQSNAELMELSIGKLEESMKLRFKKSVIRFKRETQRMTDLMDDVLILGKINAGAGQAYRISYSLL